MPVDEKKARFLLQQEPGRECHRETADDAQTLPQTRTPCQHHETADSYLRVIVNLSARFRVIVCKDGIQWILQRRDAQRSGQRRWKGVRYCTEREALIRDCRTLVPNAYPSALKALEVLPKRTKGDILPSRQLEKTGKPSGSDQ
jgi:hypothetical protein